MTQKEIRENINKSQHKEWFDSVELRLTFKPNKQVIEKIGFSSIYQFVDQQVKGWNKKSETLPNLLKNSHDFFHSLKTQLIPIANNAASSNLNQIQSNWNSVLNNTLRNFSQQNILQYDAPEANFLIDQNKINGNRFAGAFAFLISNSIQINNHDREFVAGVIAAYEFKNQEDSYLVKRGKSEKRSFAQIKAGFEKRLSESEKHLNDHLKELKNKVQESTTFIDSLINEKKEAFDSWFSSANTSHDSFKESSSKNIKNLEDTYDKLLALAKPTAYWRKRADELGRDGRRWLTLFIGTIVFSIIVLIIIISLISTDTLQWVFSKPGPAIRWSLIFIAILSILAFAIKTFSKLTFSSFHLKRDAEEREKLAYVYVALNKDGNITDAERHIIMQSLFSRSETGLLKDDGSPTMPGILEKLVNKGQ